ncbi:MAG: bifunctional methylenetetrahydrofolate dehydrogenase/methenyltetrahydrofolate cyclohydrolase FolD [Thermoleophilia bacterium]|jgi:methylenetetrahydrofolate dehydrogenase (NADP+) / methenyltetrahydrofolate cyclohydrolase|nr:bifunctional methylenetetrahydrofolate dehydrogenase/methenyltetrahydrofolate cyclohydrolase FolD [Thermoleophilia bacterium]
MDNLIDGKAVAASVRAEVAERTKKLFDETGIRAGLAVIIVGEDPASEVYVRNKHTACHEAGMHSLEVVMPAETTQAELEAKVDEVSADPAIHGLIVQMPLPSHLDTEAAIERIPFAKDADGLTSGAMGRLMTLQPGPLPCTPAGVIELLKAYDVDMKGAHAVIVGRSEIVGKPQAHLLLKEDCTVTICHSRTKDLEGICQQADILVAAVGRPKMLGAQHVKDGAVVIDVGINRLPEGLCGDVDFDAVQPKARLITPVPGGVGPMTIAMLLKNTVLAAEASAGR